MVYENSIIFRKLVRSDSKENSITKNIIKIIGKKVIQNGYFIRFSLFRLFLIGVSWEKVRKIFSLKNEPLNVLIALKL